MPSSVSQAPAAPAPEDPSRRPDIPYQIVLERQPALVTGANSGIGRAVALGLARAGADVAINYVTDPASADEVAHEIASLGRKAITVKGDVSREDDVVEMFAAAVKAFGTLHVVVSNAGLQRDSAFDTDDARPVEHGHRRQPDRPVPLHARSGARIHRRGLDESVSAAAGQDHLP